MFKKIYIAVYQTEIPQNLGAIIRSCACLYKESTLIIIQPISFPLDNKFFRRTKMDYNIPIIICSSFDDFLLKFSNYRKILFTPYSNFTLKKFIPKDLDILFFGKESTGVPLDVAKYMDVFCRIPMNDNCRSLNLATSVSIVLYFINSYVFE